MPRWAAARSLRIDRHRYKTTRNEIITIIETLLSAPNLRVQDEHAVWQALDDCERPGVGVSDALIAASDRLHGCSHTFSFDAKACKTGLMTLLN